MVQIIELAVRDFNHGLVDEVLIRPALALARFQNSGEEDFLQDAELNLLDGLWYIVDDLLLQRVTADRIQQHICGRSSPETACSVWMIALACRTVANRELVCTCANIRTSCIAKLLEGRATYRADHHKSCAQSRKD